MGTKILITGAAGCIGKQLVQKLISSTDYEIHATDIKPNPFTNNDRFNYQTIDIRTDDFIDWVRIIKPAIVVHLASVLQLSKHITREEAYKIDVVATERLVEALTETGAQKFIITTSGASYGYYPENKDIITEERAPRGNPEYFYSAHKAEVESILEKYRGTHPNLKQLVFRPGAILGPDFEGPVVKLFQQRLMVGLMGYEGPFNFIWSEDVVDYLIEGITTEVTGTFNIAGDKVLSMKAIANMLSKPYLALPDWLIKVILGIAKPLGLTEYGPEQTRFIKYRPVLSNSKIKKQFQHQPRYDSEQVIEEFMKTSTHD